MKKSITTSSAFAIVAIAVALTFSACKKGDTGPAGKDGKDGNANVIGTNNVTISSWSSGGTNWTATITVAGITQSIIDKGSVSVFVQYGSDWWSMPDINGKNSMQYGFGVGYVNLLNQNSDGTLPTNPGSKTFRVVFISASAKEANPNVNWQDYNQVKQLMHLAD